MLMVTDGQMQETHSQPTVHNGKTGMETTTETTLTGTMLMHSPMIQASGQTVTAMATEIDQSYLTVISSLTTQLNGATSDGDGYGDNPDGNNGDQCPELYGESTIPAARGCPDSDNDGVVDPFDALP